MSRHCSARLSAKTTDRGNSRSSSRNSAAAALGLQPAVGAQERLVGAAGPQRATSTAARRRRRAPRVATSRDVMSARSTQRPSIEEVPALVAGHRRVGGAVDQRRALAHPLEDRRARARAWNWPLGIARYVVLMASHIGTDSVSRARRALSRAAASAEAIEAGDDGS